MRLLAWLLLLTGVGAAVLIWPGPTLSHVTTTNTVLFDREVVTILDAHCVGCHAPDGLAEPFVSYEETWLSRGPILEAVLDGHMPPWAAVPGYGEFANDNRLTTRETQFLVSWVEGLGPRNDGAVFLNVRDTGDVPEVVQAEVDFPQWRLGQPDVTIELPETVVDPTHGERIEHVTFDSGFESPVSIRGLEYRPGSRSVVRAATFTLESTGQWLGSWTPWHGAVEFPEGAAVQLPQGARIVAEIYYGTTDVPVVDQGAMGLWLTPAGREDPGVVADLLLESTGDVPPGSTDVRFRTEAAIESDTRILSLLPEFNPGIDSIEVSVRHPDGGTEILLFAQDIPVEWPTPYILQDPLPVPAGSRIRATAYYSNRGVSAQPGGFRLTLSRY